MRNISREIKFRAFDNKQNKMIYDGDLYSQYERDEEILNKKVYPCKITNLGILYINKLKKENLNNYVELTKDGKNETYYSEWEEYNICLKNIELNQYTGLEDKNGKEIYEGDIMRHRNPKPFRDSVYKVTFLNGGFVIESRDLIEDLNKFLMSSPSAEVIGTIYENSELLEGHNNG